MVLRQLAVTLFILLLFLAAGYLLQPPFSDTSARWPPWRPPRHGALPPPALQHTRAAEDHRVRRLPGYGKIDPVHMYSGYIPVAEGKELFYIFVEAEEEPQEAPVLLWMTGGPGCSSVGTAWIGEHGPFLPVPGQAKRLMANRYSFHRLPANVIYLDTPALVGFSYSNRSDDKETGDERMAEDNLEFIKGWLRMYPKLASNPFWLAGESYAGHYIPQLAWQIMKHNNESDGKDKINFEGFLAGNPSTDPEYDNKGRLDYWWSHGLISQDIHDEVKDSCNFSNVILGPSDEVHVKEEGDKCKKAIQDCLSEVGPINIQGIFQDKCKKSFRSVDRGATDWAEAAEPHAPGLPAWRRALDSSLLWPFWAAVGRHRHRRHKHRHEEVDMCITGEGEAYLSQREVQDALHANSSDRLLDWEYQGCTEGTLFNYSHNDQLTSQLPLYRRIMSTAPRLRILIYTGDTDALVPLTGTRRWAFDLGQEEGKKKKTHWRWWKDPKGQVGGYLEEYEDFTYIIIRHASHEAPYTAPLRTSFVYKMWLAGRDIV